MDRLKVGIIFGGCSEEHPISVKSAQEVAKNLDIEKYEPFYIGITKSGAWKLCDGPDADWETVVAVQLRCHRTEASTDCLFWSRDNTKRSVWIWCFPFCTANSARMVRSRVCWSFPASPMLAAMSKVLLCVWTNPLLTSSLEARELLRRIS